MQLPPLPIPNNFQYLEEQYWQVYDSVSNTFRIYTALDNVQLATGSAGSGEIDVLYDAAQAALEVWADTITLNGTLTLPGQNVTIIARVIQLTADATIDVSGASGAIPSPQTPFSGPAANGAPAYNYNQGGSGSNGSPGSDGATGGNGQDGGILTVYAQTLM